MKLRKSIHMPDAVHQMANASSVHNHGRWNETLMRCVKKWDIASTLIYTAPNGIKQNFYLDNAGAYVVNTAHYADDSDYPVIGEVTHTDEMPEIEW